MTRSIRAAVALLALALLTGCTAQPGTAPGSGSTVRPAVADRFACPTVDDVAALTAVPFTSGTASSGSCAYSTASDVAPSVEVMIRRPGRTLAALRYTAARGGAATADAPSLAFDAFTTTGDRSCTAWFTGVDGLPVAVTAQRTPSAAACALATAVATLTGTSAPEPAAPTVAVLAATQLLGGTAAWPWRIGRDDAVRIDRVAGGYLRSGTTPSFTAAAALLPADSAAVVFVSGAEDVDVPRLQLLRATTAALSAAATRAPNARLIVVGPVADGTTSAEDLTALQVTLRGAARVAGARYVDPAASGSSLTSLAAQVSSVLRSTGVAGG